SPCFFPPALFLEAVDPIHLCGFEKKNSLPTTCYPGFDSQPDTALAAFPTLFLRFIVHIDQVRKTYIKYITQLTYTGESKHNGDIHFTNHYIQSIIITTITSLSYCYMYIP